MVRMSFEEIVFQGAEIYKASKALILLHGRGGTALGISALAEALCDDSFYVAIPQSPNRTWYPQSFMVEDRLNEPYLSNSIENVKKLLDETAKHIPKERIYIAGFSQGACMSLEIAARFAAKYGGIIAFTGGLIGSSIKESNYQGDFAGTKVFIGNSDKDPHVPLARSEQSKAIMQKLGAVVTLKVYPGMEHTINEDEINWVKTNIFADT